MQILKQVLGGVLWIAGWLWLVLVTILVMNPLAFLGAAESHLDYLFLLVALWPVVLVVLLVLIGGLLWWRRPRAALAGLLLVPTAWLVIFGHATLSAEHAQYIIDCGDFLDQDPR